MNMSVLSLCKTCLASSGRTTASESLASCWFQPGTSGITLLVIPVCNNGCVDFDQRTSTTQYALVRRMLHDAMVRPSRRRRIAARTQQVLPLLAVRVLLRLGQAQIGQSVGGTTFEEVDMQTYRVG